MNALLLVIIGGLLSVVYGFVAYRQVMAADAGLDGIIVSNHGARSEDSGRSTIDALPEIVEAVKGRIPIFVDSGFRHANRPLHGPDLHPPPSPSPQMR